MSWQDKLSTLSQEVCRRLQRISKDKSLEVKTQVLNKFNQKLIISGYSIKHRREITISGIRAFYKKYNNPEKGQIESYRDMSNVEDRRISKSSEKAYWFNKILYKKNNPNRATYNIKKKNKNKISYDGPRWVDGILMVPRTVDGKLCRQLRDAELELRKSCPNTVKVLEDTGTQLKKILSHDPWSQKCP